MDAAVSLAKFKAQLDAILAWGPGASHLICACFVVVVFSVYKMGKVMVPPQRAVCRLHELMHRKHVAPCQGSVTAVFIFIARLLKVTKHGLFPTPG